MSRAFAHGRHWIVDASGCKPSALQDLELLRKLFSEIVHAAGLRAIGNGVWEVFPVTGGVTGLQLLAESHLSVHTFPEEGFAAFDLYCCTPRRAFEWEAELASRFGAEHVNVRVLERSFLDRMAATPATSDAASRDGLLAASARAVEDEQCTRS